MSEQEKSTSARVEENINSSESRGTRRRHSVIEVLSDESDDGDVEIISETLPAVDVNSGEEDDDEIQITGHQQLQQTAPPIIRRQPTPVQLSPQPRERERNVRRRTTRHRNNDAMLFVDYDHNEENGQARFGIGNFPEMVLRQQRALFRMFHSFSPPDEVSSVIMRRLELEDENTLDRKIESENRHNRKMLMQKQYMADGEVEGYTSNISPEKNHMCELCGVILGEGIPKDFQPDAKYDENLAEHAQKYRVNAPWFCIRQCFEADIELSKRVFMAKCGHVFCGRCIKNIGNRPTGRRSKKNERLTILNPHVSAPRKCPAPECGFTFTNSKRTFTELYL